MAVTHINGDVFGTEREIIGHGVNIRGVMGAGIAVSVKRFFPDVFDPYRQACFAGTLVPGETLMVQCTDARNPSNSKWIANMASQDNPGPHARLEWFRSSLESTMRFAQSNGFSGIAIPHIGAGIGGLDLTDVFEVIDEVAENFPSVDVDVYNFVR